MEKNEPIVVFGIPRSGSTWFAKVLAANGDRSYLHEPDNEKVSVLGYVAKEERFPFIKSTESEASKFIELFRKAVRGNVLSQQSFMGKLLIKLLGVSPQKVEEKLVRREIKRNRYSYYLISLLYNIFGSEESRVVKSVHAALSIPVLIKNVTFKPVIVFRHPAAVVASMVKLQMPDADRKIYKNEIIADQFNLSNNQLERLSDLGLMGLQIGIFYWYMNEAVKKYGIPFYLHESLCQNPENSFKSVFKELELNWNEKVSDYLRENNKPGDGFETQRVASLEVHKWKNEFEVEEIEQIRKGYLMIKQMHYNEAWR